MHLKHCRRLLTPLAEFLFAITFGALPARARSLDKLRRSGVVGERYDGLAVVLDARALSQVRAMVADINAERRRIYSQRAAEQGVSADLVGRVYAQENFRKAPPGTWFLKEDGHRIKK